MPASLADVLSAKMASRRQAMHIEDDQEIHIEDDKGVELDPFGGESDA